MCLRFSARGVLIAPAMSLPQPARVSAGYPRSRAFRALGSHARVNLGILLEGRANSSAQLRSFPRHHPELPFPFNPIGREVLVIDCKNDGKRFALRSEE